MEHQAYLWIGPEEDVSRRAIASVQQQFCEHTGCGSCHTCTAIFHKQHYGLTWLAPEHYYTIKQLEPLFDAIRFSLQPGEGHIIVLERADLLTVACANSLLKSLEEPPPGYHFILMAPRTEGILPTIASRCVRTDYGSSSSVSHRLLTYFTHLDSSLAAAFMKELEKERVPEAEIPYLLDGCLLYWQDRLTQVLTQHDQDKVDTVLRILDCIEQARQKMAMPGSSKLFLKNLFLSLTVPSSV